MSSVIRSFGATGYHFFPIGLGTIWLGRPWPPKNESYTTPTEEEIATYLDNAVPLIENQEGRFMIDTSSGYGLSQARLGDYFRAHPDKFERSFIATKFGSSWEKEVRGENPFSPTLEALKADFATSIALLGRVDLLYYHLVSSIPFETSMQALRNAELTRTLVDYKRSHHGGLKLIGASISDPTVLAAAHKEHLLAHIDVIQVPILCLQAVPDVVAALYTAGKAIVLNSPIRLTAGKQSPEEAYQLALSHPHVSMVLTGSRTHLKETVGYAHQYHP